MANSARVAELMGMMLSGLFRHDRTGETERIIQAYLSARADLDSIIRYKRNHLVDLVNPELCPDEFIQDLAANVGLDQYAEFTNHMTVDQFRKVIPIIIQIWKEKGTAESCRDLLGALTGQRMAIIEYPQIELIDDLSYLPLIWTGGLVISGTNQSLWNVSLPVTNVWVQKLSDTDPGDDLVDSALEALRPVSHTVYYELAELVETWDRGAGQWDVEFTDNGFLTWHEDERCLELGSSSGDGSAKITLNHSGATSYADYDQSLVIRPIDPALTGGVYECYLEFYRQDASTFFQLDWQIYNTAYNTPSTVSLNQARGGPLVNLTTFEATFLPDRDNYLTIQAVARTANGPVITIWLNGDKVFEYEVAVGGAADCAGTVSFYFVVESAQSIRLPGPWILQERTLDTYHTVVGDGTRPPSGAGGRDQDL